MSATCQAWAELYLGRGTERQQYAGNCVLERGHDGDHLPHTLQAKQAYDQAFNAGRQAGLDTAISVLDVALSQLSPETTVVGRETLHRIVQALGDAKR